MPLASPLEVASSGASEPEGCAESGPDGSRPSEATSRWTLRGSPTFAVLLGAALLAGVVARLWPRSALWLDEAQTVAFAREPVTAIPAALLTDGAPPLYYLMLHGWMRLFGTGDGAVRSLSVAFSLATLPVFAVGVRRFAGSRTATVASVLLLTSPFAVRYATEARMYALVVLLVSLGMAVYPTVLERRSPVAFGVLATIAAALLWTHYWSLYLLAAVACLAAAHYLCARARGDVERRDGWRRVGSAVVVGAIAWLPWYRSWRQQWEDTGTPWSRPVAPWRVVEFFFAHAGGWSVPAIVLGSSFIAATVAALVPSLPERWQSRVPIVGDRPRGILPLAAVVGLAAPLAFVGARVSDSAAEGRYTAVLLPLTLAVVAAGTARMGDDRIVVAVLVIMAALAAPTVIRQMSGDRTPAREVAAILAARARSGDLLVICPEQLGPATARELSATTASALSAALYPAWASPERIDWVGYGDRYRQDWPAGFASEADVRAGDGAVWLLWSETYPTSRASCRALAESLRHLRPAEHRVLEERDRRLGPGEPIDRGALSRFPPAAGLAPS